MAEDVGKGGLFSDDLYSDFDVSGPELADDLARVPDIVEAVRKSQLARRIPSTSTASRLAPSIRRSTEVVAGTRPLTMFDGDQSGRPIGAVQKAGYSSASTPGTAGSAGEGIGLAVASATSSFADAQQRNEDQPSGGGSATIWNRIRRIEKIVTLEVNASCDAHARGEFQSALSHAKVNHEKR